MKGSLLGPQFSDQDIEGFLRTAGAAYEKLDRSTLNTRVAELLANEKVIGWFNGRMEFGPRALGSRSILGDPRSTTMQSAMNLKIKFRESFRPFAPAVLRERVHEFFDHEGDSPYMLVVAQTADAVRRAPHAALPATTHVDGSARLQTVERESNPDFYDLIKAFEAKTGCPVLINTSFNVRGEPIVCTPEDAYRCFMKTGMDYLVLGSFLLSKTGQPATTNPVSRHSALRTPHSALQDRRFVVTLGGVLLVGAMLFAWRGHPDRAIASMTIAVILISIHLAAPSVITPLRNVWMGLAHALSRITTPIILGLVYFLVLTPIGFLRRTFGRNPLRHDAIDGSLWRDRRTNPASDMKRQF